MEDKHWNTTGIMNGPPWGEILLTVTTQCELGGDWEGNREGGMGKRTSRTETCSDWESEDSREQTNNGRIGELTNTRLVWQQRIAWT